jgi:hypothetical protein
MRRILRVYMRVWENHCVCGQKGALFVRENAPFAAEMLAKTTGKRPLKPGFPSAKRAISMA